MNSGHYLNFEKRTIKAMIKLYCRKNHHNKNLCSDCCALFEYTIEKLDKCPLITHKPLCKECHIHCYKPDMQQKIKTVMRFSGPRLIFHKPLLTIKYLLIKK